MTYQQNDNIVYRVSEDGVMTPIGEASKLRRYIRRASDRLRGCGDPREIARELVTWANCDAPNAGATRNANAAAEWLTGTSIRHA